jgi:hypothetical protein
MGLFSKKDDDEPSYSRQWISRYGPKSRKMELSNAALKRTSTLPVSAASAWGQPLDEAALQPVREVIAGVLVQDRSLARHVTRDLALLFESLGGLYMHQTAALESVGARDGDVGASGAMALAVARTIKGRHEGTPVAPSDEGLYISHFEDPAVEAYERALSIGAWAATVTSRLRNQGTLRGDGAIFFEPGQEQVGQMWEPGLYPSPVNAGDTSRGDASIERFWDGHDWTSRVRSRDGRRWNEQQVSLFRAPSN